MTSLRDFIISRVRVKLLTVFLASPGKLSYIRELTRATGEEINAVRRELIHMTKAGMVSSQKRGNRLYYWFNTQYRFYPELVRLVAKITGLGESIIKNREKIGRVKFAAFSARFAKALPTKKDHVDLLIVGEVVMPQIAALVRAEEDRIKREINYSVMTEEEFTFRKNRRDTFILDVLKQSRIMLIGDEDILIN